MRLWGQLLKRAQIGKSSAFLPLLAWVEDMIAGVLATILGLETTLKLKVVALG